MFDSRSTPLPSPLSSTVCALLDLCPQPLYALIDTFASLHRALPFAFFNFPFSAVFGGGGEAVLVLVLVRRFRGMSSFVPLPVLFT